MVRVPNTQSLLVMLGQPMELEAEPLPYSDLTERELDQLIIRCRRAIYSHHRESLQRDPERAEDALSARDAVQKILMELWAIAPEAKRAKIEAILRRF